MKWLEVFGIKVCQKYVKTDFGKKHHAKNIVFMRFEAHEKVIAYFSYKKRHITKNFRKQKQKMIDDMRFGEGMIKSMRK